MSKRLPNGLAWTLLGLTVVLLAATVVLGLTGGESWSGVFGFIPATLSFALVGALIAVRAGNRLGWFFLAGATVTALSVAAKTYAVRTPAAGLPGAVWAGWALTVSLGVTGTFLFLTPLLFPDGRPPSPRWRPVVTCRATSATSARSSTTPPRAATAGRGTIRAAARWSWSA